MSLAKTLLNSLDDYEATEVDAVEEEPHIIVGSNREITVPAKLKLIAVKGDKDIETVTIDCVRYWDNHDLSTFAIYINYILPNGDEGTYIPKNITKLDDIFTFDWKIGNEITYAQGKLTFWIVAKLTDDSGDLIKQWSSLQNSDCSIAQGGDKIYVPEKQTDQDVISQAISISRESAETAEQQANLAIEAANKAALDASRVAEEEVSRIIGELGVVQELGDSPNSVVSQLKVTNEFNQTNAKINRNSKRITNLEQGFPYEQFMTDSTVAHVKDVPVNALPFAEVSKVGGMTHKDGDTLKHAKVTDIESMGTNLMDSNSPSEIDKRISVSAGTSYPFVGHNISSYISVKPNTVYWLSNISADSYISFYTLEKAYISGEAWANSRSKTSPDTAAYVRIDYLQTDTPMLNEGSTILPYTPYMESTLPIPEAVQALDGYGFGVNETVYNYIDWEKKRFVKRVGVVDMGTLTWSRGSVTSRFYAPVTNAKDKGIAICSIYDIRYENSDKVGYLTNVDGHVAFVVNDSAYTDATSFKAAMSGVMLYYELAEHIVTDLSDIITEDNLIGVEGGGTLTFVNEYGYAVPSTIEYQLEV